MSRRMLVHRQVMCAGSQVNLLVLLFFGLENPRIVVNFIQ